MTYTTTQTETPVLTLDGEELKIGDEVIIARQPVDPDNDALWTGSMCRLVGRRGVFDRHSENPSADALNFGGPVVLITIGGTPWWFRLSELSRPATYHQPAPVQPQAQPEPDTPTEFPNLVHTNETTGPGPLHPAVDGPRNPYNPYFLTNERRLCPYDHAHGTLSLRPGYDAYLTECAADAEQSMHRERFYEWSDARKRRRALFKDKIREQLTTNPFSGPRKGRSFNLTLSRTDKLYYAKAFAANHKSGRDSARIIGKLTGHFHPTRPRALSDDEAFMLLQKCTREVAWRARDAIFSRPDHPINPALRAYINAMNNLGATWQHTPWQASSRARDIEACWFLDNEAALARIPHISGVNPQEVAYYQSVDKLIRGIETRTKPGRFLAKFFPNLTPDQVRQYANDYLVVTAPKQLHIARTRDEIIMAIDEGPSESCQTRGYYGKAPDERPWFNGHIHPAACYASGDFEVAYITDNNKPASIKDLHAGAQRITARAICNATNKTVARIYGDYAKLEPLLDDAGYEQKAGALVGCRLLQIENKEGSGWIMPYVDAGIGSGGGSLDVAGYYDADSGKSYWMLVRPDTGEYSTYEGYDKKGVLEGEKRHTCPRCDATHDYKDDVRYSDYEDEHYCSECEDDFVGAVVRVGRYGNERDMVLQDNAIEIDGDWYANDGDLLARCGFVQCIHCDEWTSLDNTTTTDSGQVCCEHQVVELAEESPDGNEYGYRPDCTQYVDVETGETVWLDDNTDADDFTTDEDTPKYVDLDTWREMQQRQESFEFVGPPKHNPVPYALVAHPTQFDDLRI